MKNYELMKLLSDMTAGAEVKINILLSQADLEAAPDIDVDNDGMSIYRYSAEIKDLDTDRETIYLYT